jgi:hypothetical protein
MPCDYICISSVALAKGGLSRELQSEGQSGWSVLHTGVSAHLSTKATPDLRADSTSSELLKVRATP